MTIYLDSMKEFSELNSNERQYVLKETSAYEVKNWHRLFDDADKFRWERYKCKTDLFYLMKYVLEKDVTEQTHKQMCDFYVKKDVRYKTFKDFAKAYKGPHDRIQLVPRNTFKSSIKVCDNVQWILCWPEIRIMTCTSTDSLSAAFIDELISYFTVRGKAIRDKETGLLDPKTGRPTLFQKLFWEHCINESEAKAGEYIDPARQLLPPKTLASAGKEPTAGTISMEGSTSGWHCDIEDFDDPVSDKRAETGSVDAMEKLSNRIAMITELMMNYGFRSIVATRYDVADPYGKILESGGIKELYGDFHQDGIKAMMRPCWWLKGLPYQQPDYNSWEPKEEDVDLFFPEGSPFDALVKKMKNPKTFSSQQLNNPQNIVNVQFTEQMVRECIIDHTALPKEGTIFASWDFAYGQGDSTGDYSAGVVGLIDTQKRWWIIDIIFNHYNFSEKCYQVVKAIRQFRPLRTCIEDNPGTKGSMDEPIARYALNDKVKVDIDWIKPETMKDAKFLRVCALHPWMVQKRIFFLNTITCFDEMIKQFKNVRSGMKPKNDICDTIARLVREYSKYAMEVKAPPSQQESTRQFLELAENEFHNMMYRKGKYSEGSDWDQGKWSRDYVEPQVVEQLDPDSPSFALDELYQ